MYRVTRRVTAVTSADHRPGDQTTKGPRDQRTKGPKDYGLRGVDTPDSIVAPSFEVQESGSISSHQKSKLLVELSRC